uniref:Uncharacterized protein n=1 Tax=Anguilla anguilla TaxID=7936 RepID=A0A0E9PGY1_ANGAN
MFLFLLSSKNYSYIIGLIVIRLYECKCSCAGGIQLFHLSESGSSQALNHRSNSCGQAWIEWKHEAPLALQDQSGLPLL